MRSTRMHQADHGETAVAVAAIAAVVATAGFFAVFASDTAAFDMLACIRYYLALACMP